MKGPPSTRINDLTIVSSIYPTRGESQESRADRKPDEPMTAIPSMGVSKYFKVSGGRLVEVNK